MNIKKVLLIIGIILASLIFIWGIYASIISFPLPFSKGWVVGKYIDPYKETQERTKEDVTKCEEYINSDGENDCEYVHDYYIYRLWLIKDYEDYIINIQNKRVADYIFWKTIKEYTTTYYITKEVYDVLNIDSNFDVDKFGGTIYDNNNQKILLKRWDDRYNLFNLLDKNETLW